MGEPGRRCMVQVQKDEFSLSMKKISSCRLHDLMHDLYLSKGEEKGLTKLIDLANCTEYAPTVDVIGSFRYMEWAALGRLVLFPAQGLRFRSPC